MLKIVLVSSAALAFVAVAGIAWAKHRALCDDGDYMQHVTESVARKLDLDDDQSARLQEFAKALRGIRGSWTEVRTRWSEALESLLAEPSLDRGRAQALIDERRQAMTDRTVGIIDAFADFTDSLRPEQRARLAELIARRLDRPWVRHGWVH